MRLDPPQKEIAYALYRSHRNGNSILFAFNRLRKVLRPDEMRNQMHTQAIIMLSVTVLTMVYLFYALLRPEKF